MKFLLRSSRLSDLDDLYQLASQFTLLNLPADRRVLSDMLEVSQDSFLGRSPIESARYIFCVEDLERQRVVGCSQIKAKHGTLQSPTYSFQVMKRELFSQTLGIGFIHQVLRLRKNTDGPSEVGGLVVDRSYRGRPERIGKWISLVRFLFVRMFLERFQSRFVAEMAPPLTEDGRSEFWEALGRRFTGLPYTEADSLSHTNKEFIDTLFPSEDIYLTLLDARARMVMGRVAPETQAAVYLLKSQGFTEMNEVDPFDGGPHLGSATQDIGIVSKAQYLPVERSLTVRYNTSVLVAKIVDGEFQAGMSAAQTSDHNVDLPDLTRQALKVCEKDEVWLCEMSS